MPGPIGSVLLIVLAAATQISVSPASGRIVGRVVDGGTGAPSAGVSVWLNGPISPTAPWPPPAFPLPPPPQASTAPPKPPDPNALLRLDRLRAETNADGIFEIRDVPNGRWAIQARKDGYVSLAAATMPLIEVAGRNLTAPEIRLDRGGIITGRVLDARGNPMSRVTVRAVQFRRLPNGTIQTTGGSTAVETNDVGEYRLSGIAPGEHYVVAQPQPPRSMPLIGGSAPAQATATYVATFYPGFHDAAVASPVTVVRGTTTPAIEFSLQTGPAYQVGGVVIDAGGRPVAGAIVRLAPRIPFAASMLSGPSDANGRFRVTNVPAGTYGVMAAVPSVARNGGGTSASLSFGAAARPGAAPEVTVQGDAANLRVIASQP